MKNKEPKDKRTREYKEWKANHDNKSKGLGDTIAKATKATKLDKVADKVAKALGFDDCGCKERQERLNKAVNYRVVECFTEEEFNYLKDWFENNPSGRADYKQREKIIDIHTRVFKIRKRPSCGSCGHSSRVKSLKRVYDEYI